MTVTPFLLMKLWLMTMHTKFGYKWGSGSQDIVWTHNKLWSFIVTSILDTAIQYFHWTLWLMVIYHQQKHQFRRHSRNGHILIFRPSLWYLPSGIFAWHSSSWSGTSIPSSDTYSPWARYRTPPPHTHTHTSHFSIHSMQAMAICSRNGFSCLNCGISRVLESWPFRCALSLHLWMVALWLFNKDKVSWHILLTSISYLPLQRRFMECTSFIIFP